MIFKRVEISHFRNLISTSFNPSSSLNLISGSNGSGKSSLLEALHYLANGSSYRTNRLSHIVHHNSDCFTLFSEIGNKLSHRIGIKRCRDLNHQTRIDGQEISRRSELVQIQPLQVLSPESISLLIEGSEVRRSYIDWALFHVEQSSHYHLSNYTRVLKQRNALLKNLSHTQVRHWDSLLVEHGVVIDKLRREYVDRIKPITHKLLSLMLPEVEISFSYRPGWSKYDDFMDSLEESFDNDIKLKYTTVGPHRADLSIKCGNIKASETLSRGQQKLVVIALKLAQAISLYEYSDKKPVILIDDIAAELDVEHRALLLETVKTLDTQVFITTPELDLVDYMDWNERKVFHVEHGKLKVMV